MTFFYLVQSFGKKLKIRDFVNLWLLYDQIQGLATVTCGIFQIYFYDNLFNPVVNSKIQNKKTDKNNSRNFAKRIICFKRPIQKRRNNKTIRTKTKHNNNMTGRQYLAVPEPKMLVYLLLLTLDR